MERFVALVLTQDVETLRVISRTFEEFGLEPNVAHTVGYANELVRNQRFDLAVCDYDSPDARQLAYLDPASAWRGMFFAVVRQEQTDTVKGQRVHLTLPKPLTPGLLGKGLRAVYTTLVHERRVAFRYPVEVDASWGELSHAGENSELGQVRICNVSRTGMCIETPELLPQQATISLAFDLPESGGLINVEGDVVWSKSPGRSGIRFSRIAAAPQKRLSDWLETKVPPEFEVRIG